MGRAETETVISQYFEDGKIYNATDDELNIFLQYLCTGHVANDMVRHREMNRCQTINTVKMFRFVNSIEKSNKLYTKIIILLTILTLLISVFSIFQSIKSSNQTEQLIKMNEEKLQIIQTLKNNSGKK